MQGLVAFLSDEYEKRVLSILEDISQKHGLRALLDLNLRPHFTFFLVDDCISEDQLIKIEELLDSLPPFDLRTVGGLGIFTGERPVIYIPIIRDRILASLHLKIWEEIGGECEETNPLYSPSNWIPHITLAHIDLTRELLPGVIDTLADRAYVWNMVIDQLALITGDLEQGFNTRRIFHLR